MGNFKMNDEGEWINERSRKDSNGTSRAYSIPLWPIARGQAYRGMRHDREDIHTPKNIDTIYPRSRKALFALVFSFNLALWEGVS